MMPKALEALPKREDRTAEVVCGRVHGELPGTGKSWVGSCSMNRSLPGTDYEKE